MKKFKLNKLITILILSISWVLLVIFCIIGGIYIKDFPNQVIEGLVIGYGTFVSMLSIKILEKENTKETKIEADGKITDIKETKL